MVSLLETSSSKILSEVHGKLQSSLEKYLGEGKMDLLKREVESLWKVVATCTLFPDAVDLDHF